MLSSLLQLAQTADSDRPRNSRLLQLLAESGADPVYSAASGGLGLTALMQTGCLRALLAPPHMC